MTRHLIITTRYPEPGKAKSWLIPALGIEGAAQLQREMTRYALRWADTLRASEDISVEVAFEGGTKELMKDEFGDRWAYRRQEGADLGERLALAFQRGFRAGAGRIIVVGTDCPGITAGLVLTAFERLQDHDVVLGPAVDGASSDASLDVAKAHGARTLSAARGRARQMNAGAALATSPILLFLHADTRLPTGLDDFVVVGGLRLFRRRPQRPQGVGTGAAPWTTTWLNQAIVLGYTLGIAPERLGRWYAGGTFGHGSKRGLAPSPTPAVLREKGT